MTHPLTPEMLPCPFCGGQPEIENVMDAPEEFWFVSCSTIGCEVFCQTAGKDRQSAIAAWNRRHSSETRGMERRDALVEAARNVCIAYAGELHTLCAYIGDLKRALATESSSPTIPTNVGEGTTVAPIRPDVEATVRENVSLADALDYVRTISSNLLPSEQAKLMDAADIIRRKAPKASAAPDGSVSVPVSLLREAYRGLKRHYEMPEVRKQIDALLTAARPQPERREG